ncbi:MAG: hypothetical protein WAM14_05240 [Candidatus Nitrosopolaris sp.]
MTIDNAGRIIGRTLRPENNGVFSSMKRIFGDHVSARKFPNMTKEMMIKASLYNMFIGMK